ncbi:chaplin [Streptomyces atratus]|uniref:Small secreted domain n=1 Tax=Streptomyces atratus TaxID=1893 RepID=A0A1K2BZ47_STRAR|nr:chaplin [Streptomyces atratus]SFY03205.1 Small secreted domain [Streptomyces atratus]
MRKALSKSVLVVAAASGILTAAGGYAFADASADGVAVGSPGIGSGNNVQVPVHVPVNVCGNTVNVIGLLNPAFGNKCVNEGGQGGGGQGASAEGGAVGSPGVLSGNNIQAPVDVPVNVCGNTVDIVGALNPAAGNTCVNEGGPGIEPPVVEPPVTPPVVTPPVVTPPVTPPVVTPPVTPPVVTPPVVTPPVTPPVVTPPVVTPPVTPPVVTPPVVTPPVTPPVVTPPVVTPPVTPVVTPPLTPRTDEPRTGIEPGGVTVGQLAHTGADADLGLAGGAAAALVLGGSLLVRRTRAAKN